ncbi:hypothetical protein [Actinoplanes aureus]|uniref:Uncharacterized protein n=1 Tax=Actinoplanes aureus TaxID=2792083 RepID=A0A931G3F4_9ACTN|nr:hypothetical protein [Actinoplanes aureus]MBG0568797.1 hypothetical protein [Actinoplanes aureus]
MSAHRFPVNDKVICDPTQTPARYHGIVYIVKGHGPKNAILTPVNGGKGLRIPEALLLPAPEDGAIVATVAAPLPPLDFGAVVTVHSPAWTGGNGLHVVLADRGDKVKLVPLGGNQGKYWPGVPRAWVREVDRTALLAAVAGLTAAGDRPR